MKGSQRYKCKNCGYQFISDKPRGKPLKDKVLAISMYLSGMSMTATAKIIGTTTQSVMCWIRKFYEQNKDAPMPEQNIEEVEIDEMFSYIHKKKQQFGYGKCYVIAPKDFLHGFVVIVAQTA